MFPPNRRTEMIKLLRQVLDSSSYVVNVKRSCIAHAYELGRILQNQGYRPMIQAGTASFQIVPDIDSTPEDEDTHFTFKWNGVESLDMNEVLALFLAGGPLPEMHCWLALPDGPEIIDPTTRYVEDNVREMAGLTYRGPPLPDCFWWTPQDGPFPTNLIYEAEADATWFAMTLMGFDVDRAGFFAREVSR